MRRARPAEPRLSLSIQIDGAADDCPADRRQLRRWVRAALVRDAMLTLRLVGEPEARALNAQYRGRDYATNVLTFAYDDDPAGADTPAQADIVICLPVLAREAREQRKPLRDHLAHLVVHGVLHAQGMDHEDDDEAREMEARETEVLRRFGIDDPYR
jgi:probable rRNA maturation factor